MMNFNNQTPTAHTTLFFMVVKTNGSVVVAPFMVWIVQPRSKQTVVTSRATSLFIGMLKRSTLRTRGAKLRVLNTLFRMTLKERFSNLSVTVRALN